MFLEEKIDKLKSKFSPADFRVPYTDGIGILKSIERKFIITRDIYHDLNNLRKYHNDWADNIKSKVEIKLVTISNQIEWLDHLDCNTNYWTVITQGNVSKLKHLVYDCKPISLFALFSLTQSDFFVIDKKYNWLTYFKVDAQNNQARIYKSGKKITPFES